MRILLSAYACEPNKGSEPEIGWRWATELAAAGHEVHVITRANNRAVIEDALRTLPPANIRFIYVDIPRRLSSWKRRNRGIHLYYLLWQLVALRAAHGVARHVPFDVVHHITFGVVRQPTFLWALNLPLVLGPVGGAERAPLALRASYPLSGHAGDFLRDLANIACRLDPITQLAFRKAALILCKTPDSLSAVPSKHRKKARVQLELGSIPNNSPPQVRHDSNLRILYVGRLVHWKGAPLALRAFASHRRQHPEATLTIVGEGPERSRFESLACRLNVARHIEWLGWLPRAEVLKLYGQYDVFLFPSLRDSSGNVVLEALSQGLPTICLDIGGPGTIVDSSSGITVSSAGSEAAVVNRLADALDQLAIPASRALLSSGALSRAAQFHWRTVVSETYRDIAAVLAGSPVGQPFRPTHVTPAQSK